MYSQINSKPFIFLSRLSQFSDITGSPPKPSSATPMWRLHRAIPSILIQNRFSNLRPLSFSATASQQVIHTSEELPPSLDLPVPNPSLKHHYIDGFPRPDPKYSETIVAVPRDFTGKSVAARERKVGRVPSILFEQKNGEEGGNKRLISVKKSQIWKLVKQLGSHFFLSRLFELEVRKEFEGEECLEKVRVLPRLLHLHPTTDEILNVTFMRAPSSALLKINVPLLFRGEDVCPGLRKGGYLQTLRRTVQYICPADIVPPYIDVDLSDLDVEKKLFLRDLKVHPSMVCVLSRDQPICKIKGSRSSEHRKKPK